MKSTTRLAGLAICMFTTACSVTQRSTEQRAEQVKTEIGDLMAKHQKDLERGEKPLYKRIHAVYVGSKSAPIAHNAVLPPAINEMAFQLPRRTNLATAAKIISKLTKYPTRINPDVYNAPRLGGGAPDSGGFDKAAREMPSNLLSAQLLDADTSLPTDFDGPLKDYLDTICGSLNINWEFEPSKGFYFYRLVTKMFEVKLHAGDNNFDSTVTKGSTANPGQTGSSNSSGSAGAYSGKTGFTTTAKYSGWQSLEAELKTVLTGFGRYAIDVSANTLVVRDTREVIDEVEKIVNRGNEVHGREITLSLRVMRVAYDDNSAAGAQVQAAYTKFLAGGLPDLKLNLNSPGTLVSSDSGGLGFGVLGASSRWNGSQALVQAVNQLGTIVSDDTKVVKTMNRRTMPIASFDTDTYLAETQPSSGGALGVGGGGVPGLKPAQLTTGFFVEMTPTAFDNGTVWMDMVVDQSQKRGQFGTASTGSGETFQQIQLPNTHADNTSHAVGVKPGESLVLVSIARDSMAHSRRTGLLGASGSGERHREMQLIIITPTVRSLN
jgi:type IVB pilus formation R64 PilN family outer membrane protein